MSNYDDIIDLPHYKSQNRNPMPMENRAAQFAPFAALSGHNEAISETARITDFKRELTNEEKLDISKTIKEAYSKGLCVIITYFIPDQLKTGGQYASIKGRIVKLDEFEQVIILFGGLTIPMDDIYTISIL